MRPANAALLGLLLGMLVGTVACSGSDSEYETDGWNPDQCEGSPWTDTKRPWIACWVPLDAAALPPSPEKLPIARMGRVRHG